MREKIILSLFCVVVLYVMFPLFAEVKVDKNTLFKKFDDAVSVNLDCGKIKITGNYTVREFFGNPTLDANVKVTNTSNGDVAQYNYYAVFYDASDKVVGCVAFKSFSGEKLKKGKSENTGSCLVQLPKKILLSISHYEVVVYVEGKVAGRISKSDSRKKSK